MVKSVFNFKIQDEDGSILDLHEENLFVNSFRIISLTPEHSTEYVEGKNGSIHQGTKIRERKITTKITVETDNHIDFDKMRDWIYSIFNPLKKFYIIRDLQPSKRIEVRVSGEFDIDYIFLEVGEFQVDFLICQPFFESVSSTLNPDEYLQVSTDEPVQYLFSDTTFKVWNEGNIAVDPREFPFVIAFKGKSNNLTIRNLTNGDEWRYNGSTTASDTVYLDGIMAYKNNDENSIFGNTNFKTITLNPKWNDFEIIGATAPFTVSFNFKYYYI